jgi:2-keto-4-pentenoate hydratase/2-oxohepta-3-ene-1,7-dioic acid hydratase in catechol pathway
LPSIPPVSSLLFASSYFFRSGAAPTTPFLKFGDVVEVEMLGPHGSIFGKTHNTIKQAQK